MKTPRVESIARGVLSLRNQKMLAFRKQIAYNRNEVIKMPRTSNIYIRIEPEIKEQAEAVLNQLGIPMSNAVALFLRQVVMQRGIPFEMKLPAGRPLVMGEMTKEQLDAALQEGLNDVKDGNVFSADVVEEEMKRLYGV